MSKDGWLLSLIDGWFSSLVVFCGGLQYFKWSQGSLVLKGLRLLDMIRVISCKV